MLISYTVPSYCVYSDCGVQECLSSIGIFILLMPFSMMIKCLLYCLFIKYKVCELRICYQSTAKEHNLFYIIYEQHNVIIMLLVVFAYIVLIFVIFFMYYDVYYLYNFILFLCLLETLALAISLIFIDMVAYFSWYIPSLNNVLKISFYGSTIDITHPKVEKIKNQFPGMYESARMMSCDDNLFNNALKQADGVVNILTLCIFLSIIIAHFLVFKYFLSYDINMYVDRCDDVWNLSSMKIDVSNDGTYCFYINCYDILFIDKVLIEGYCVEISIKDHQIVNYAFFKDGNKVDKISLGDNNVLFGFELNGSALVKENHSEEASALV